MCERLMQTFIGVCAMLWIACAYGAFPLSANLDELRSLPLKEPKGLYRVDRDSEIIVSKQEMLFVLYGTEGSGIIIEWAYVYECNVNGACSLLALPHVIISEGASVMHHEYNHQYKQLSIFSGNRLVMVIYMQPDEEETIPPLAR